MCTDHNLHSSFPAKTAGKKNCAAALVVIVVVLAKMVRKRLDERVRTLLEKSVVTGQRSMLVLVGDHGKDQVPNLHYLLSKTRIQSRPKVLWCYKKELGFSTHKKKRMKKLQKKLRGLQKSPDDMDNFELFLSQTDITWCYYRDSHRVLGTTVGMLVLQDFEALTPNLLARTIETVEGGGLVVFLLRTVKSLKQLYAMTMDVHSRYRTQAQADVVPRFNERFILSLGRCTNCLVCDDELNVLPLSRAALQQLGREKPVEKDDAGQVIRHTTQPEQELTELQESLHDTPHVGVLVDLAKTLDQAKALLVFLEACSSREETSSSTTTTTVAMTAARGRGKSAAMGLCLAGAISLGYSNIGVTAPSPENLVSVFDFCLRGLEALKFQQHLDYTIRYNNARGREETKCVLAIHMHHREGGGDLSRRRQVVQYVAPTEPDKLASAELVAIDEAAAIPLPLVQKLMSSSSDRLTFLSSTVNGYEGTGRALSLKLLKELRDNNNSSGTTAAQNAANAIAGPRTKKGQAKVHEQRWAAASEAASAATNNNSSGGKLKEIQLSTPIRYAQNDPIEAWLNRLLCLDWCVIGTCVCVCVCVVFSMFLYTAYIGCSRFFLFFGGAVPAVFRSSWWGVHRLPAIVNCTAWIVMRSFPTTNSRKPFCRNSWACTRAHTTKTPPTTCKCCRMLPHTRSIVCCHPRLNTTPIPSPTSLRLSRYVLFCATIFVNCACWCVGAFYLLVLHKCATRRTDS